MLIMVTLPSYLAEKKLLSFQKSDGLRTQVLETIVRGIYASLQEGSLLGHRLSCRGLMEGIRKEMNY